MTMITIQTTIDAPINKVWQLYTTPADIMQWNNASPDWFTPRAENDLRKGGKFVYRMEAKDGSAGFDFEGVYDEVQIHDLIEYSMTDGRKVKTSFTEIDGKTTITIDFDPENENPIEMQQAGWQSILDNFKRYVEKE